MAAPNLLVVMVGMLVAVVTVATSVEAAAHGTEPGGQASAKKQSVDIVNQLPGNLDVHCQSRDDDLKLQTVAPGATYRFVFQLNWIGTTSFSCTFIDVGTKLSQSFEAYHGPGAGLFGSWPCRQCIWQVNQQGFARAQLGKPFAFIYPWIQSP